MNPIDMVNITKRDKWYESNYRYRRPRVLVQQLKSKGVQTAIVNWKEICRALQVIEKDFAMAFTKMVKKKKGHHETKNEQFVMVFSGVISAVELDDVLQILIEKFILCPTCHLPERKQTKDDGEKCLACGWRRMLQKKTPSEATTKQHSTNDESMENEFDMELSTFMHKLYHERDKQKAISKPTHQVDKLLDKCWRTQTLESWNILKRELSSFFLSLNQSKNNNVTNQLIS